MMNEKKNKKLGFFLLSFIVGFFFLIAIIGAIGNDWIIDGNKVYVDDSNVYISAEPHTIFGSGYVYFNLTSKVYSGNVDLVWGFDTDKVRPTRAEIYNSTDKSLEQFNNDSNWKDISQSFNSINYDYQGMNKWYYLKNIPIIKDKNYLLRGYIQLSPQNKASKYWFAIKPSSETLQQAIANGHLYALDPWFSGISFVYDEIDDSSVNASLWNNFSDGNADFNTLIETADYMQLSVAVVIALGEEENGTRIVNSSSLPNVDDILNLTMRVSSLRQCFYGACLVYANFSTFGNLILAQTDDDSVWTFIENNSCGADCFDVFDDGVYDKSINTTNNEVKFHVYAGDNNKLAGSMSTWIKVYYVYYAQKNKVILNSPTDNFNATSKDITFNCSAGTFDGNNVTNISLWTNSTGTWALNQTNDTSALNSDNVTVIFDLTLEDLNTYIWNCNAFDTSGNESWALTNYTINMPDLSNPDVSIISPSAIEYSTTITVQINATDNYALDYCYFNITKAGVIDVSNTEINQVNFIEITEVSSYEANYVLHVACNDTSANINQTNKTFTVSSPGAGGEAPTGAGGAVPVVYVGTNETLWTMETEGGTKGFEMNVIPESRREKDIYFENLGISERTIKISCENIEGDLCGYVRFSKDKFTLPVAYQIKTVNTFTLEFPSKFDYDKYVFNIIATDELGQIGFITTTVNAELSFPIEIGAKLITSKKISGYWFPYIIIFGSMWLIMGVVGYFTFLRKVSGGPAISGIASMFFSLFIIYFI